MENSLVKEISFVVDMPENVTLAFPWGKNSPWEYW